MAKISNSANVGQAGEVVTSSATAAGIMPGFVDLNSVQQNMCISGGRALAVANLLTNEAIQEHVLLTKPTAFGADRTAIGIVDSVYRQSCGLAP